MQTDLKKNKAIKLSSNGIIKSKKTRQMFILTLPAIIKVFIFAYLPMFGIIIAFKNLNYAKGIFGSSWVGFKNFEFLFKSDSIWLITRNTVGMNAIFIVSLTIVGVICAILLDRISKSKLLMKSYQVILFFPFFLSWVVVAYLLNALIGTNGSITSLCKSLGFDVQFMLEAKYWPFIMTVVFLWKAVGYRSLLYYSVLIGVDRSLYEAAYIDGANDFQIMKNIQIPAIIPMIVLNCLMDVGNIFRGDFGMFYFLPGSANTFTLETTEIIDTFAYRAMKDQANFSLSAAVGVYQSIVGFILIMGSNWLAKKYDPDVALF